MALRWEDVDLAKGLIHVERAYDEKGRVHIEPKSRAGRRTIPIIGALRDELLAHMTREGRDAGLVFGSSEDTPFVTSNLWRRAQVAWVWGGCQDPVGTDTQGFLLDSLPAVLQNLRLATVDESGQTTFKNPIDAWPAHGAATLQPRPGARRTYSEGLTLASMGYLPGILKCYARGAGHLVPERSPNQ